ncbi:MAG: hypothetical protein F6J94_24435 [Moorea sp. SIO1F2]|uniref:hypothetical protein n=1 Tax=unclassified Moorena TaxID=2683338 RepID=UPI0013BD2013|nr:MULTISPECIES: hypothetical protein [unclassified Moorena]NEO04717.1 hypothetical protein [Moorena sp. SIO3I8]NEO18879.1 hypothetical protein [Moorena sp. SIO4A5]NEQ56211.1 hypothetical protein [Moorena sp. SIO4A1]NET84947.1 hypothetical protein [Moorena sp. SIO1F2]
MSESENPNNLPLPESTTEMDNQDTKKPDQQQTDHNPKMLSFAPVPDDFTIVSDDIDNLIEQSILEQTIESLLTTMASSVTEADNDGTDDTDNTDIDTEIADVSEEQLAKDGEWFALAQKLRLDNHRLQQQVTQLQQALQEKQQELNGQAKQLREYDKLLSTKDLELNTVQDQLTRLFHTLESSHQSGQRQQILVETLSEQLQSSQDQVARLEQDYSQTQQRYNEQSHQLVQLKDTCRELRTRLYRQQQQTLQFKVALEKCLEMPASENSVLQQQESRSIIAQQSLLQKAQAIRPWSADPELFAEEFIFSSTGNSSVQSQSTTEALSVDSSQPNQTDPISPADASGPGQTQVISPENVTAKEIEVAQQLIEQMSALAEEFGLSELPSESANAKVDGRSELETTNSDESDQTVELTSDLEQTSRSDHTQTLEPEANPSSQELPEDIIEAESQSNQTNDVFPSQGKSPSPVLYPLRPSKGRKSLASIELPRFPRYRSS